jgi:dihydrofolate reductase
MVKRIHLGSMVGCISSIGYFSCTEEYRDPRFRPEPGSNREEVERLFADSGAFIFGRRTYEITNGWGGRHPVNGAPVFVLTHNPPKEYPNGLSRLTFVTDGIASAIRQSQEVAGGKNIKLGGASPGKQALAAGLCDEIVVHLAPYLLGGGVRLFDELQTGTRLEKLAVKDGHTLPISAIVSRRVNKESEVTTSAFERSRWRARSLSVGCHRSGSSVRIRLQVWCD